MFQPLDKLHRITGEAMSRRDYLRLVKSRAHAAGLPESICNHTFRGTGIPVFLQNGGALEAAQDGEPHRSAHDQALSTPIEAIIALRILRAPSVALNTALSFCQRRKPGTGVEMGGQRARQLLASRISYVRPSIKTLTEKLAAWVASAQTRAYELYELRGRIDGRAEQDWYQAETDLTANKA